MRARTAGSAVSLAPSNDLVSAIDTATMYWSARAMKILQLVRANEGVIPLAVARTAV